TVPVGLLAEIGATLVAVHGQNDQVRLQGAEAQRRALDAFGGAELAAALRAYRADHAAVSAARRERDELTAHRQERAREAEALQRSLEEIDLAEPRAGEDAELRELIRRLEDVEELRAASGEAHARLAGAEMDALEETPGAVSLVEGARQAVLAAPGDDPALA
ncbi:DNA repair protein RecN, partial [Micrococcus sp. HG099]|nr:DNA repair protein RecN [Micrococcus sp. HG099]